MVVVIGALSSGMALANHSIPQPLYFWDPNDNSIPGPDPDFDNEGPSWSQSHINRLNEAVAEWSSKTSYDPGVADTSYNIFVDGREPPESCLPGNFNQPGGTVLAITCRDVQARVYPGTSIGYYRIIDDDIYFNMENPDSPNWWVGPGVAPDNNRIHFGGVLVHELGHTVRLIDLSGSTCVRTSSDWITMCGTVNDLRLDTWRYFSLHADDISAANAVY